MQNNEIFISIVFFLLVTGLVTFVSIKQKKSSWEGVLIKKKKHYDSESLQTSYKLVFRTSEGKKKRVQVKSEKFFNDWLEGDKAVKVSGEYFPKKV